MCCPDLRRNLSGQRQPKRWQVIQKCSPQNRVFVWERENVRYLDETVAEHESKILEQRIRLAHTLYIKSGVARYLDAACNPVSAAVY